MPELTKREYFALEALKMLMNDRSNTEEMSVAVKKTVPEIAVDIADSLIAILGGRQ